MRAISLAESRDLEGEIEVGVDLPNVQMMPSPFSSIKAYTSF